MATAKYLLAGLAFITLAQVNPTHAQQAWPERPVRLIVGYPAGGTADVIARAVAKAAPAVLGTPVVVENKAGASGIIATDLVVNTKDNHVLLFNTSGGLSVRPHVTALRHDPWRDLTVVGTVSSSPYLLVIRSDLGPRNLKQLIAYATANPGKLNMGISGAGTLNHLVTELLVRDAGIRVNPVQYPGASPAMLDLMSGNIDALVTSIGNVLVHLRSGKVLPIAVTGEKRDPKLPDVPTAAEQGYPRVVGGNTYAIFGPAGMPGEQVAKMRSAITHALADASVRSVLDEYAYVPENMPLPTYLNALREEERRFVPVIEALKLRLN